MKKLMNIFVLVAAAAMTLASCQKNEIDGPVNKEVHFTIKADFAETKTAITDNGDKTYTPSWANGDKIGVLFSLESSAEKVEFENTATAGETATFEGKNTFATNEYGTVEGNLYAFYPSSAFNKMYDDGGVRLYLEATQNPTSTSFDPSCDLLIAKPCYYMADATGEQVEVLIDDMYFARMMSVLRINLNSEFLSNETVKSISFDADGVDFTGAMKFNLETGEFVGNQSTSQDLSEVKAVYSEEDPIAVAGEKNSAYLVVAPVTIPSGTALTFTIETENYDIVKTINAPADMEMPAGNIAVINLTIAEENCTAKVEDTSDYSGTYAIIAENSSKFYYLTNVDNGASTKRLNSDTEMTSLPESGVKLDASLVWNIVKNADGTYLIQSAENDLYLDHTSGNSSVLVENVEDAVALTIEETEGKYAISYVDSNSKTRNFVKNSSNPYFAFYTSSQCGPVYFVPAEISLTPAIIVAETDLTQSVAADATELSFNYQVKNISGVPTVTVASGATMTNVSANAADGTVTVTFDANEEETAKSATITLSYEGATSVNVVINQAAKAAEGAAYYEKVTSAPTDWSGKYLIVFESINACWDGSLKCGTSSGQLGHTAGSKAVMINDNTIEYNDSYFVVEKSGTAYTITSAYGDVIGNIGNSNSLKSDGTYTNTISINSDNSVNIVSSDGYTQVAYNSSAKYIRFYKTGTVSGQNYPKPSLYKLIESESGEEGGETPVDPVQLTMSDITCSAQTENSLTFTWAAVANASKYEVTFNNGTAEEVTTTSYTATGLNASTSYTISVKAVGDGTNYTTSEAKTQTGTTTAAQVDGDVSSSVLAYTFDVSSFGTTGYGVHKNIATNNNMTWTMTCGQGGYLGINKAASASKLVLGDYLKVGTPIGYNASTLATAVISDTEMLNVGKVEFVGNSVTAVSGTTPTQISLVFSQDGNTYSLIETQAFNKTNGNTFEFAPKSSGYYAVVISGTAWFRLTGTQIKYYTN